MKKLIKEGILEKIKDKNLYISAEYNKNLFNPY